MTGVTGNLGRLVIEDLLTRVPPRDLVALARTPEKAGDLPGRGVEVRHCDHDDAASVDAALAGVGVLLLVSGSDMTPGIRVRQHRTVVDAAVRAGVRRVVYTGGAGAEDGRLSVTDRSARGRTGLGTGQGRPGAGGAGNGSGRVQAGLEVDQVGSHRGREPDQVR